MSYGAWANMSHKAICMYVKWNILRIGHGLPSN